jgi:hypothetical protein
MRRQVENKLYTFKSRKFRSVTIKLPDYGVTNDVVVWNPHRKCWAVRKHVYSRTKAWGAGDGPKVGILGRLKKLITSTKHNSKKFGYSPIKETPESMLKQWEKQNHKCAVCGTFLDLLKADYDHNHETGKGRGFVHPPCNAAEGHLKSLSIKAKKRFMRYIIRGR